MNFINKLFLILISSILALSAINCTNDKKETTSNTSTSKSVAEEASSTETVQESEYEKYPEGFINGNTFQVVVSSLKDDKSSASSEALSVAKKKSLQILLTYPKVNLSSEGRKELKELSESGKITKSSAYSNSRMYFVYQISKPSLEIYVKKQLK